MTNRFTVAAFAALALLATTPSRADDVADAKARFKKGAELYRAGMWREAIAEFEVAYKLKPAGAIHFNIAQCRERLSEWPGALRAYTDYLREVPDATDRPAVRAAIEKIERRLAASGVQALLVYSDPPGAAVVLDGRLRGTTPFHLSLPPGSYELTLSREGYETAKHELALAIDASRVFDVVLRSAAAVSRPGAAPPPRSAEAAAPRAPPAGAVVPPGKPSSGVLAAAPKVTQPEPDLKPRPPQSPATGALAPGAPARKPAEKRRVYTWIAAGAAGVALAAAGYFGYSARSDEQAIHGSSAPAGASADQLAAYQRDLTNRASDARSKARTANLLYAAGGGLTAAGVTLFFVEKRF